jgi:hypothetical protein
MRFCTHCGAATEPAGRSCTTCGTLLALAMPPRAGSDPGPCGDAIDPAWRYCASCGNATAPVDTARMRRTTIAAEAPAFTPAAPRVEVDEPARPVAEDRWPAKLHP